MNKLKNHTMAFKALNKYLIIQNLSYKVFDYIGLEQQKKYESFQPRQYFKIYVRPDILYFKKNKLVNINKDLINYIKRKQANQIIFKFKDWLMDHPDFSFGFSNIKRFDRICDNFLYDGSCYDYFNEFTEKNKNCGGDYDKILNDFFNYNKNYKYEKMIEKINRKQLIYYDKDCRYTLSDIQLSYNLNFCDYLHCHIA